MSCFSQTFLRHAKLGYSNFQFKCPETIHEWHILLFSALAPLWIFSAIIAIWMAHFIIFSFFTSTPCILRRKENTKITQMLLESLNANSKIPVSGWLQTLALWCIFFCKVCQRRRCCSNERYGQIRNRFKLLSNSIYWQGSLQRVIFHFSFNNHGNSDMIWFSITLLRGTLSRAANFLCITHTTSMHLNAIFIN